MLSQDLHSCAVSLGVLAGKVSEEHWSFLRVLQANLLAHSDQARQMEAHLHPLHKEQANHVVNCKEDA